jgi:hypothetical protein
MELPVIDFIRERLREEDTEFETRQGTAFYDLFIKPQQLMMQPLISALDDLETASSIRRILTLDDPNSYDETAVDDLISNLYVTRDTGALAATMVRVYYSTPRDKEFTKLTAEFSNGSVSFFNSSDVKITQAEMALQVEDALYYVDFPVVAAAEGEEYNVEAEAITAFINDLDVIRVVNLSPAIGGLNKETNVEVLTRAKNSIGVRDLETIKGINAILREKFPFIREVQAIGFGDAEMMRDILYNAHVGGKTDVYVKVPSLTEKTADFLGLDYDTTRELRRSYNIQMARSGIDSEIDPDLKTPNMVVSSVVVKEDVVETSARIVSVAVPPVVGIDLSVNEWIRIQVDDRPVKQIKISGANPSQTQRFEIINSINASLGLNVATPVAGGKIALTSPKVGAGSQIIISAPVTPVSSSNNAADILLAMSSYPQTIAGIAAHVFVENFDYQVDYTGGLIYQTSYTISPRISGEKSILSGQTMLSSVSDGQIVLVGSDYFFDSSVASRFENDPLIRLRLGDEITVEEIGGLTTGTVLGTLPQTFIVSGVVSSTRLKLSGFAPTGSTAVNSVQYSARSNQVVKIEYRYNPISVDVGPKVVLADGFNRGVRPGRGSYTISDVPFINIVKIEEIDPDTLEVIGEPLASPGGYGLGGYGEGGYGVGLAGDYDFEVLVFGDRFSVFEDSVIVFKPEALSKSFRVTYNAVPELEQVHDLTRDDLERVTGADVLIKNFIPAFVDMTISIKRDPTNISTPPNDALGELIEDYIDGIPAGKGVQASQISKILEDQGVDRIQTPFTMKATVLNPDGSTIILESADELVFPDVALPRQTPNFSTRRIVHFYAQSISVVEV